MDFSPIWASRWLLLDSFLTTLFLSAIAIVVGTLLGTLVSVLRALNIGLLNILLRAYVELFRGTPLLMQLFFVYFGLPMLGVDVDKFWAAFSAISLYTGAYVAEVMRAGVEAVPPDGLEFPADRAEFEDADAHFRRRPAGGRHGRGASGRQGKAEQGSSGNVHAPPFRPQMSCCRPGKAHLQRLTFSLRCCCDHFAISLGARNMQFISWPLLSK